MQLELFTFDEIKDCFAKTVNRLLSQANILLARCDVRFNYVFDCWDKIVDSFHDWYFSASKVDQYKTLKMLSEV